MKKFMMMVAMAFATLTASAQAEAGTVSLKPLVGITVANITEGNGDAKVGLAAGAELEYQMNETFALSVGALYSMQGCKGEVNVEGFDVDATVKLDYINIPILANVYVVKGLAVKLGIQPGFNVTHKASAEVEGTKVSSDLSGVKSVDFSIPVGLSYEFNNFVIDGRYNFGVTKIADYSDSKNSVFQFTLGYKFAL